MGYDPVVQALAEKGADLNVKNKRGQTPLAALTKGRGPAAAAAAGDASGVSASNQNTAALLRKLGAVE
jgi:hypothetical protein